MQLIYQFFMLLCFCGIAFAQRSCPDCRLATSCPEAGVLARQGTPEALQKLRNAFCGFGANKKAQVCCSSLRESNDNVETHPNLSLLPSNCGTLKIDRIIGGDEAALREFPWMVLISYRTGAGFEFKCGGTLINNRYVLTAAHCVTGRNVFEIAGVRVGEHNIKTDVDCQGNPPDCESHIQDIRVEQKIPHPEYEGKPKMFKDIALLRLRKPVDFSRKNAGAVCLPITSQFSNRNVAGANATVAGWGYTEKNTESDVLLKVHVPVYSKTVCSSFYNRGTTRPDYDATENKLCAGSNGKDSCNGDSGGPLMIPGVQRGQEKYYQHGIVSYGPSKCGSDFPGVYTDVTKYLKWILDNIRP